MATWKKLVVSGSSIAQLSNDAGYLTSITAQSAYVTASVNGALLIANNSQGTLTFSTGSATPTGIVISGSAGNDKITFSLSSIPNTALANDGITIAGADTSLGGTITAATIGAAIGTIVSGSGQLSSDISGSLSATAIAGLGANIVSSSLQFGALVSGSGQIDGASITNNTVNFGGVSVALGGSDTTPAFNLSDATAYPFTSLTSVPSGIVSASSFSSPSQGTMRSTLNGANADVDLGLQTGDSPQFTNLVLTGNLTVEGTQINANVANLDVEDRYILLNSGSGTIGDSGIIFGGSTGTAQSGSALVWDGSFNGNDGRLAVVNAMGGTDTDNKTPNYYVAGALVGTEAEAATNQMDHAGNILVSGSGEIFIYV